MPPALAEDDRGQYDMPLGHFPWLARGLSQLWAGAPLACGGEWARSRAIVPLSASLPSAELVRPAGHGPRPDRSEFLL